MKMFTMLAAVVAASVLTTAPAHAFEERECVMPLTVQAPNGTLKLKAPVPVFKNATDTTPQRKLTTRMPFYVEKVTGGRALLEIAPGFDDEDPYPDAGKIIGWVEVKHLKTYDSMNCGM